MTLYARSIIQLLSGRWRDRDQTPVWLLGRYAGDPRLSTLERFNAKLMDGVRPHHFRYQSFGDIGAREHRDRVPGACRIVVRITRAPDHFGGKVMWQFLDHPLLGIEAEHHIAVLPHLFGFGAHRVVMQ